jgi:integrase/recombinase XerC
MKKKRIVGAGKLRGPLSVNSRRRHLSSLKNFFDYLKQTHEERGSLFKLNPVKPKIHAVLVKDIDINHTRYLRPTEWELIYEKTWRTKERLILYLLYFGGLRLHELCLLKREYFNRKSGTVTFPRKGGKVHTLKLKNADAIFDQLDYWFNLRSGKTSFLFVGSKDAPLSVRAMSTLIRKMIDRASVSKEITPHSFRKACATNLYLNTKDLLYVRDYLGHSDAAVTQTYIDKNALHERHLTM